MDILDRVRDTLGTATVLEIEAVARKAGIPAGTFIKIVRGRTKYPRYDTVGKLRAYFEREGEAA